MISAPAYRSCESDHSHRGFDSASTVVPMPPLPVAGECRHWPLATLGPTLPIAFRFPNLVTPVPREVWSTEKDNHRALQGWWGSCHPLILHSLGESCLLTLPLWVSIS